MIRVIMWYWSTVIMSESEMIKEWNAVSLSLSTSFLTWNVKRIQDTLLPNWNEKKKKEWHVVILPLSTSFHMKRKKNPGHFVPKVKVRKSDKVAIGQHLVNKGQEWIGGEVGWNNELSPKEGSARRFFVFQIPGTSTATWDIEMVAGD